MSHPAVYPTGITQLPSNPVMMTDLYHHNFQTPSIMGPQAGTRAGAFASVRSLGSLAVVQKVPSAVNVGGIQAYNATMLVKSNA